VRLDQVRELGNPGAKVSFKEFFLHIGIENIFTKEEQPVSYNLTCYGNSIFPLTEQGIFAMKFAQAR
jgi:hypothetical protein